MTKPPSDIDPIKSPGLAALQEIKYQEETPEGVLLYYHSIINLYTVYYVCIIHSMYCIVVLIVGRALVLKEDGNEYFKQKKYKEAVMTYSEGLKQNNSDSNLNAILYCNRSAAHYHLSENTS